MCPPKSIYTLVYSRASQRTSELRGQFQPCVRLPRLRRRRQSGGNGEQQYTRPADDPSHPVAPLRRNAPWSQSDMTTQPILPRAHGGVHGRPVAKAGDTGGDVASKHPTLLGSVPATTSMPCFQVVWRWTDWRPLRGPLARGRNYRGSGRGIGVVFSPAGGRQGLGRQSNRMQAR